jgi:hypothetical protein
MDLSTSKFHDKNLTEALERYVSQENHKNKLLRFKSDLELAKLGKSPVVFDEKSELLKM